MVPEMHFLPSLRTIPVCASLFLLTRPPPVSTLFPYTTLFRSVRCVRHLARARRHVHRRAARDDAAQAEGGSRLMSRSEEHTSELQSHVNLVCRLLLEKKNQVEFLRQHLQIGQLRQVGHVGGCN